MEQRRVGEESLACFIALSGVGKVRSVISARERSSRIRAYPLDHRQGWTKSLVQVQDEFPGRTDSLERFPIGCVEGEVFHRFLQSQLLDGRLRGVCGLAWLSTAFVVGVVVELLRVMLSGVAGTVPSSSSTSLFCCRQCFGAGIGRWWSGKELLDVLIQRDGLTEPQNRPRPETPLIIKHHRCRNDLDFRLDLFPFCPSLCFSPSLCVLCSSCKYSSTLTPPKPLHFQIAHLWNRFNCHLREQSDSTTCLHRLECPFEERLVVLVASIDFDVSGRSEDPTSDGVLEESALAQKWSGRRSG